MHSKTTCRCCLTWNADKDLKVKNNWLGETEVYADMLKECFEVHIKIGDTAADRGICFSCILRLRDAFNFKKQVLKCQREFEKRLQKRTGAKDEKQLKVKQEITNIDDLLHQNNDENFYSHSDRDDEEDEQALALLAIEQLTKRQALRKDTTGRIIPKVLPKTLDLQEDHSNQDDGEEEHTLALLAIEQLMKRQALRKAITDKNNKPKVLPKIISRVLPKNTSQVLPRKDEHKAVTIKKPEKRVHTNIRLINKRRFAKHHHNLSNIIKYSNVTPFFTKSYNGFECAYCRKPHQDMQSLNLHSATHFEKKHKMLAFNIHLSRLLIKLDITNLKCNMCSQSLDVISRLKQHLMKEHNVRFYLDVKDCILEFKLSVKDKFDCALCNSPYETFKMLQQHMNRHYRNFLCNECGAGFVNQNKLRAHKRTHLTGEFKCSQCDKVFSTNVYRNYHEKHKHNTINRHKAKCLNCSKKFPSYYQRNRHMMKEHKTLPATYKCKVCDKSFLMKFCLTSHIKKDHLLEKKHSCEECGKQFYSRYQLNHHVVTHTGEKNHKCSVCTKAYARKKTLTEHMRIHLDDRRFKCGVCGLAFVQKCSLKGHILSKHNITLSEYEKAAQSDQDTDSEITQ